MKLKALVALGVLGFSMVCGAAKPARTSDDVKDVMKKVADWQIEHLRDDINREHASDNRLTAWTFGALYVGMEKWAAMADSDTYYEFLKGIAEQNNWDLGPARYHADDQIVGQLYLQLYRKYGDPEMIEKVQRRTEWIRDNPSKQPINLNHYANTERWTWCDALFMAPPVWAKLSSMTGDDSFRNWMFGEYKATYDHLYDPEEHLFFRDEHFIDQRDHGHKVFWSRGNGWVFGGLTLIIPELPEGEQRTWFENLYKDMAPAVAKLQTPEGHWAMSLLAAELYPTPETSGTAFYTYGLAWGINNGVLDRETYLPVVMKGWDCLVGHVTDEGMLGYVQPVGAAPGSAWSDKSEVYGVGAFLAAGSEVCKLLEPQKENVSFITFMEDAGWCWFQDPRALIADGKLLVGGIDGRSGDVKVGVYDLETNQRLGVSVLNKGFEADDHDAPALYLRPDGRLLTVYTKHANDRIHRYRISEPGNYLEWGPEKQFVHEYEGGWGITYMNLYPMKDEGLLYCFFRDGMNINPSFITSSDQGQSWGNRTHFIADQLDWQRPYANYLQMDPNTVSVSFTDAHPRQYGNGIYYAEFRNGQFFRADGTKIKALSDGPLRPSEADCVYKGSAAREKPAGYESVPDSAWPCSMALDANGNPHIAYSLYLSNDDHRYRVASWNGSTWADRQVAYAGTCLYPAESSYTGLIAMDPTNPYRMAISSDVDPTTGKSVGGVNEIFTVDVAQKSGTGAIEWRPLTRDSEATNIRPVIVEEGGYKVLLWLRGEYKTYTDYDCDIVGVVLELPRLSQNGKG